MSATTAPTDAATTTLESLNPATGEVVGHVPVTGVDTIPEIVARARSAAAAWRAIDARERAEIVAKAADPLVERAEELGALLTAEMGKPLKAGVGEVRGCGRELPGVVAEIVEALRPEVIENRGRRSTIYRDPFGVCAAITPWNYPISMPQWIVIPALTAGNTVVLKPSEETPLIGQAYADVLNEFLPAGVLQVIHGDEAQGKALVLADVDMIAFTGSRAAGKHIMEAAAGGLKRIILELGGKDPLIVLADADLEAAAKFAAFNALDNSGQACISTERVYVDESVAEEFEERLVSLFASFTVGNGAEPGVRLGPMINAHQRDHVLRQVDDAVAKGARVVYGGGGHHGLFVMPTLLADVDHDMDIMNEETFGPVACVSRFQDVDEAVELANSGPYGLGASVYGGDSAAGVARRLDAAMIGVNRGCFGAEGSPWVGAKESGYGYHGSDDGHRQFTQARVVTETT